MFYDKIVYRTIEEDVKNEIGQSVKVLSIDNHFMCDVQPMKAQSTQTIVDSMGKYIKTKYYLFTDEAIKIGDVLVYEDKTYIVIDLITCFDFVEVVIEQRDFEVKRWF